jgi:hypothetical protein
MRYKHRIEEGEELITEGHNLQGEGERLMGLSRPFDSNLVRPAFSVGKSPYNGIFLHLAAEMSANCRNVGTAQQARPLDSVCA